MEEDMVHCIMKHMETLSKKINLNRDILDYIERKLVTLPRIYEEDVECMCSLSTAPPTSTEVGEYKKHHIYTHHATGPEGSRGLVCFGKWTKPKPKDATSDPVGSNDGEFDIITTSSYKSNNNTNEPTTNTDNSAKTSSETETETKTTTEQQGQILTKTRSLSMSSPQVQSPGTKRRSNSVTANNYNNNNSNSSTPNSTKNRSNSITIDRQTNNVTITFNKINLNISLGDSGSLLPNPGTPGTPTKLTQKLASSSSCNNTPGTPTKLSQKLASSSSYNNTPTTPTKISGNAKFNTTSTPIPGNRFNMCTPNKINSTSTPNKLVIGSNKTSNIDVINNNNNNNPNAPADNKTLNTTLISNKTPPIPRINTSILNGTPETPKRNDNQPQQQQTSTPTTDNTTTTNTNTAASTTPPLIPIPIPTTPPTKTTTTSMPPPPLPTTPTTNKSSKPINNNKPNSTTTANGVDEAALYNQQNAIMPPPGPVVTKNRSDSVTSCSSISSNSDSDDYELTSESDCERNHNNNNNNSSKPDQNGDKLLQHKKKKKKHDKVYFVACKKLKQIKKRTHFHKEVAAQILLCHIIQPQTVVPKIHGYIPMDTIVMERVDGQSLYDYLDSGKYMSLRQFSMLVDYLRHLACWGLEHGDLHGGNIMMVPGDSIVVIDYGRASITHHPQHYNDAFALYDLLRCGALGDTKNLPPDVKRAKEVLEKYLQTNPHTAKTIHENYVKFEEIYWLINKEGTTPVVVYSPRGSAVVDLPMYRTDNKYIMHGSNDEEFEYTAPDGAPPKIRINADESWEFSVR